MDLEKEELVRAGKKKCTKRGTAGRQKRWCGKTAAKKKYAKKKAVKVVYESVLNRWNPSTEQKKNKK